MYKLPKCRFEIREEEEASNRIKTTIVIYLSVFVPSSGADIASTSTYIRGSLADVAPDNAFRI